MFCNTQGNLGTMGVIEQKSHLSYIKVDKNDAVNYRLLHTFYIYIYIYTLDIHDMIIVSKPLIELIGIFPFLPCKCLDMGKTSFAWLIAFTSIQSKIKINNFSSDPFVQYFPISFIRSKGIQIGDHDIKIVNFANNTSIVLRDITSLNRLQVILKLYGHRASSSKVNFSKA